MGTVVAELKPETFAEAISTGVVLVDFWAPWCGPCRMQGPILKTVAGEVSGRAKVVKVDVDGNEEAASRFQVHSIPTLVLLKDGAEVRRFVGVQPREALVSAIETALSGN